MKLFICELDGTRFYVAAEAASDCMVLITDADGPLVAELDGELEIQQASDEWLSKTPYYDEDGKTVIGTMAQVLAETETPSVMFCSEWG